MNIRPFQSGDRPSMEIVRKQALEHGLSEHYSRSNFAEIVATDCVEMEKWIRQDRFVFRVGESSYSIVSFGVLDRINSLIKALYTAPSHQDHGWASKVLQGLEQNHSPKRTLKAQVPINAVGFFRKHGFKQTGSTQVLKMEWWWMERSEAK